MTDNPTQPSDHAPKSAPEDSQGEFDSAKIDQAMREAIGDAPATPSTPDPKPTSAPAAKPRTPEVSIDLEAEIADALAGVDLSSLDDEPPAAKNNPGDRINLSAGRRTRTGIVTGIRGEEIFVEFGPKSSGICPLRQFETPPATGESCEFVVERLDSEGMLVLSIPGAIQKADWSTLEIGQTVEGRCIGLNKGGLEIEVAQHKGFMPAGQVDVRHIPDISVFLGEKLTCRVTQLDRKRGRLVLSRRAVVEEERAAGRDKLMTELEAGQTRTVVVTSVQAYGAFADLGGVDGLIHVTELTHDRIRDPGEVVKVGDEFEVKVLKVDTSGEQPKIGLSRKSVIADPRADAMNELKEGETVNGTVKKIMDFGAFIEISSGVEGLVHISEVSHERIPSVDKVLREGEVVQAKILSMDSDRGRISLSIKALVDAPARSNTKDGGRGGESARAEDPEMRKLKAKFGGDLRGGLG